jgi:tetratricopeptide (TPR) repeat protein
MATASTSSSGPSGPTPREIRRQERAEAAAAPRTGASLPLAVRTLTLALLAAATFFTFAGVLRNGWIFYDDPRYVYENPHVNQGLKPGNALWFLAHAHDENWHPLTSWSHMLDVQLFGLEPAGPHAVNLALHVLNAVLLVLVLYRLTGGWWRSVAVGAFFALHPLRVESVAWVAERKDVLSGLLFVLTLEAYRRWVARPGRLRHAALVVVFALGLMAKPMLVTVPFVLVLLDVWPLGRLRALGQRAADGRREAGAPARPLPGLIVEKWPLFALAASSSVVTFLVQRQAGAVASVEAISFGNRLANALVSCWHYIGKTLWPDRLAPFYPMPPRTGWAPAIAAAGLLLVTLVVIGQVRKRPYLAVGWFWYLGMLVPVIGLVQVGAQAYADRYTYLPVVGLVVAFAWGAGDIVARSRAGRIVAVTACALALVGLSTVTVRQVALWKNTWTLFSHTLAVTRENPIAHQNLGDVLLKRGEVLPAMRHYEEVLRLAPGFADARNKLGSALGSLGRFDEAIAQFQEAIRLGDNAEFRHNLGFAFAKQGRTDDAIREYEAALRLDHDHYLSLVHLGEALGSRGRLPETEVPLRRALELRAADNEARRLLAVTLVQEGRAEEAVAAYGEILRRSPDDLDALNNVAWIRAVHASAALRNGAEAVRLAERARNRSPRPEAVLYSTLAAAYAEAGRFPDAVRACERAIELARDAGDAQQAAAFTRQLSRYRAGKPFHIVERRGQGRQ